jgi:ribosomal protein L40E
MAMTTGVDISAVLIVVLFIAGVVAAALVLTAMQNRRHVARTEPRLCRTCALSHPPFALYCRRCGRKL